MCSLSGVVAHRTMLVVCVGRNCKTLVATLEISSRSTTQICCSTHSTYRFQQELYKLEAKLLSLMGALYATTRAGVRLAITTISSISLRSHIHQPDKYSVRNGRSMQVQACLWGIPRFNIWSKHLERDIREPSNSVPDISC